MQCHVPPLAQTHTIEKWHQDGKATHPEIVHTMIITQQRKHCPKAIPRTYNQIDRFYEPNQCIEQTHQK